MLCDNRDMKPAIDYFSGHETLMYSALSNSPFNSLALSMDSSVFSTPARGLPVDLSVLGQLAAKQSKAIKGNCYHNLRYCNHSSQIVKDF